MSDAPRRPGPGTPRIGPGPAAQPTGGRQRLTPQLITALGAAVVAAGSDPEVRAVVLTGTGDRAFCAGMDQRSFAAGEAIGTGDDGLVLTGDSIDAERAYELGLLNRVVSPDEVLPTALALAQRIAENAPLGLAASKELVRLAITDAGRAAARLEHWRAVVFTSEDAREGATAFVEKRQPVWNGR